MSTSLEDFKNGKLSTEQEATAIQAAYDVLVGEQLDAQLEKYGIKRIKSSTKMLNLRPMFLAAAALCLLIAAFLFFQPEVSSPQSLADAQIEATIGQYSLQTRAVGQDKEAALKVALDKADYAKAEALLNTLLEQTENPAAAQKYQFYKGFALLHLKDYEAAMACFDDIKKGMYAQDATWLSALAALKANQNAAAKSKLETIAATKGWIKAIEAQKIIEAME